MHLVSKWAKEGRLPSPRSLCPSVFFIYSWVREINIIYMSGLILQHTIYIQLYGSLSNKNIHSGLIQVTFSPSVICTSGIRKQLVKRGYEAFGKLYFHSLTSHFPFFFFLSLRQGDWAGVVKGGQKFILSATSGKQNSGSIKLLIRFLLIW